jgi:hypothetical protein
LSRPSCARHAPAQKRPQSQANVSALSDRDFAAAWDMLSGASQKKFEQTMFSEARKEITSQADAQKKEPHPVLGKTGDEILKMSVKDFFVLLMGATEAGNELAAKANGEVASVKLDGGRAHLALKDQKDEVILVKEQGTWKIDL